MVRSVTPSLRMVLCADSKMVGIHVVGVSCKINGSIVILTQCGRGWLPVRAPSNSRHVIFALSYNNR